MKELHLLKTCPLKSVGKEFREEVQRRNVSGAEVEDDGVLRGSTKLFPLYNDFHDLAFPKGSNQKPPIVITKSGVKSPVGVESLDGNEGSEHY